MINSRNNSNLRNSRSVAEALQFSSLCQPFLRLLPWLNNSNRNNNNNSNNNQHSLNNNSNQLCLQRHKRRLVKNLDINMSLCLAAPILKKVI